MSASNLERSLDIVFGAEGGLSLDRRDPGNWTGGKVGVGILKGTKYGIAASAFPQLDIANITKGQAAAIFRQRYWDAVKGDSLAPGVDLAVFDAAVNSGPGTARKWLLQAVGGPDYETVAKICSIRLSFVRSLSTWATYGKGWAKRIATIEATGITWSLAAAGYTSAQIKDILNRRAGNVASTAANQSSGGKTAGSAGTVGGAAAATFDTADLIILAVLVVAFLGFAAWLFYRAHVNRERAKAYSEIAAKSIQWEGA